MKGKFSKRALMSVAAFAICICVAVASFALPAVGASARTVTVDFDTVVNENYLGIGDNYWVGPYDYKNTGMMDAYQTVNDKHNNVLKPAYVRMMFFPHWLVDRSLTAEEQEAKYMAGDYYFESEEFKAFVRKSKSISDGGGAICLNMGGGLTDDVLEWWGIEHVTRQAGGKSAPDDLGQFAHFTTAIIERLLQEGVNVQYLSFYNEINNGCFEAFFDKRIYWTEMIKEIHIALTNAGLRDDIEIFATELTGYYDREDNEVIGNTMKIAYESLIIPGYADYLNAHTYQATRTAEQMLNDLTLNIKNVKERFPQTRLFANEFGSYTPGGGANANSMEFNMSDLTIIINQSNLGYGGSAGWFYLGDRIPEPTNMGHADVASGMSSQPSYGLKLVSENFNARGLAMRYIPRNSKVVKSTPDSDDVNSAVYVKGDETTVLLEIEPSTTERTLKVKLGTAYAGKAFGVHVDSMGNDTNRDGHDDAITFADSTLLATRSTTLTVDAEGYLTWTVPTDEHNLNVVMTTLAEQVQVEMEMEEVSVMPGGSVDIAVKDIYGVDTDAVDFELYDFSAVGEADDYKLATDFTNVGTLSNVTDTTATFNANAGLKKGDVVAIKVTPRAPMTDDVKGYGIVIVRVGEYVTYYRADCITKGQDKIPVKYEIGQVTDLKVYTVDKMEFGGWYLTPDFSGDPVTKTDASWNNTTVLYGKFTEKQ